MVLGLWVVIGVAGLVAYHAAQLPPIDQIAVPKRPPNIAILASDGSLIANRGETGGRTVNIKELPPYLPKAFVAIEDRRFYDHFGIDPVGIGRAIVRNLSSRGVAQGGSTLTQQLAKNLFLTQERTASRKIQEAILALWLERNYSKDEILELYLNRVYFGAGAYGVEAAAQRYYGKSARDVTLSEAAVLAGKREAAIASESWAAGSVSTRMRRSSRTTSRSGATTDSSMRRFSMRSASNSIMVPRCSRATRWKYAV
jgi:penicillin-binding protein 1A